MTPIRRTSPPIVRLVVHIDRLPGVLNTEELDAWRRWEANLADLIPAGAVLAGNLSEVSWDATPDALHLGADAPPALVLFETHENGPVGTWRVPPPPLPPHVVASMAASQGATGDGST